MHRQRQVDLLVDPGVPLGIGLRNRILEDLYVPQRGQLPGQGDRLFGGVEALVRIDGHLEPGPGDVEHRPQPLDHRLLDAALDLDAPEPLLEGALDCPPAVFRGLVSHPVVGAHPLAHGAAEQGVQRQPAHAADEIEHRRLEGLVRLPGTDLQHLLGAVGRFAENVAQRDRLRVAAEEPGRPGGRRLPPPCRGRSPRCRRPRCPC